ncbi:hypothetical protein AMTRI_Chr11g157780 [Amborella trichopoda]
MYTIIFGAIEMILSQFPNYMAFSFGLNNVLHLFMHCIGLGLGIAKIISHGELRGSLSGVHNSPVTRTWNAFQALGNIAFAYTFAGVLLEIQDTLRSPPPENKTMKRATLYGIAVTTIFYMSVGFVGYAAFGNHAPGNLLTGFYESFLLIDIANLFIVIHLVGACQKYISSKWSTNCYLIATYILKFLLLSSFAFRFTLSKLKVRSLLVIIITLIALILPFFNAIMGLLGALAFWPLTVYFPTTMYISQMRVKQGTRKWILLRSLNVICFMVSLMAIIGSVAGIFDSLKHVTPFKMAY